MQKRHFIVKVIDGDYQLKEIDAAIAKAMSLFGIIMGEFHTVESNDWLFYFMNCPVSSKNADELAEKLSQKVLEWEQ